MVVVAVVVVFGNRVRGGGLRDAMGGFARL